MRNRDDIPDPAKQVDPFEKDPTETEFDDPVGGIDLTDDFQDHDHQICPVMDPRAAQWQEHSFFIPEGDPPFESDEIYELARFFVPTGLQGRVSVLETGIQCLTPGDALPLNQANLYPYHYEYQIRGLATVLDYPLMFYLRLESWKRDALPGAPRQYLTRASLPGIAYPPLGSWKDARYDYSRQAHPSLLVPEAHYLTLWVELVERTLDRLFALYGRLGGVTQSYKDNPQSIDSARTWRDL